MEFNEDGTVKLPSSGQPPVVDNGAGSGEFMNMVREGNELRVKKEIYEDGNAKPTGDKLPTPDAEEDKKETDPTSGDVQEEEEESEEEIDVTIDPLAAAEPKKKPTQKENIINLRESLKSEKEARRALEAERDALKVKTENITEAEEVKTLLADKDKRIAELEKYEDLLGLYKQEGFKEAYYDSIDNLKTEAVRLATDYGVGGEVIDKALAISNRKELNQYLSEHFDPVGVTDVRKYILDAQAIAVERSKVEENPKKARQELIEIMNRAKVQRSEKVRDKLKVRMKNSWDSMLSVYTDEDAGLDILKDVVGDAEHNQAKQGILKRAETEFGKAVGVLIAAGIPDIPEPMVKALAARFQLSEVAGHLAATNKQLSEELEAHKKELKKTNGYSRPLSNGSSTGKTDRTPKEVPTEGIAAHVMGRALAQSGQ